MCPWTYTAIVTPVQRRPTNTAALERLVKQQNLKGGVDGIVPVGTTRRIATVDCTTNTSNDHRLSVKFAAGKIKVTPARGLRLPPPKPSISQSRREAGCRRLRPSRAILQQAHAGRFVQHFHAIARATKLPILLYSIPGRSRHTKSRRDRESPCPRQREHRRHQRAGGNRPTAFSQLRAALGDKSRFSRATTRCPLPFMSVGAQGVISVASNVIPREVSHMVNGLTRRATRCGAQLHNKFYPLVQ